MKSQNVEIIAKLKEQGFSLHDISEKLAISIEMVEEGLKIKKSLPMQIGHFQRVLEKKKEQNASLENTQQALVLNVRALWQMIEMLEAKKKYIENAIEDMEKYVKKGSAVADVFIQAGIKFNE